MRVNNISGLNFTRGIIIRSNTNPGTLGGRIDDGTMNVIRAIQKQPSIYDRETSAKIRKFFKDQIGDISKNNKVYARRIQGRVYIFTGEEAKLARGYDLEAKKKREELERKFAKGITPDMDSVERIRMSDKGLQRIDLHNVSLERDGKILKLVEDGDATGKGYSKPDSRIELEIDKRGRLKKAKYHSFDGTGETVDETLTL